MGSQHRRRAGANRSRGRRKKLIAALQWQHRWGAQLKAWQKTYDEGRDPPPTFYSRPELSLHLEPIHAAFFHLTTERQSGMGMGPIPRSKIIEYAAEELDLGEDETDRFYSIIRKMDDEYIQLNSTKSDRPLNEVSVDDVDGVKSIFRGLESRASNGGLGSKPRMKN